jgi:sugar fermentation stimulation protein A
MASCLEEGGAVWLRDFSLSPPRRPQRKLRYGWEISRVGSTWVLVNTSLPNRVVEEALEAQSIQELAAYSAVRAEVPFGEHSRVDFLLTEPGLPDCYLEVKSATLEHRGVSYFPDGVTTRGTRHLQELATCVRGGHRAVLLFLVSREDTRTLRPAAQIDPDYSACLRAAQEVGVEILVYQASVSPTEVVLRRPLPLELDPGLDIEGPLPKGKTKANRVRGGWSVTV